MGHALSETRAHLHESSSVKERFSDELLARIAHQPADVYRLAYSRSLRCAQPARQSYRSDMAHSSTPKWQGDKGRRRSMRVLLTLPVKIHGMLPDGKKFDEETHTLVVNAHGALVTLVAPVAQGQTLTITNKATLQKLECRAVFIGPAQGGKTQVGVEFAEPSSPFWQINFPPEDWKS